MLLVTWLLSLTVGGDVKRLGSEHYHVREQATANLAAFGWLARPYLLDAARSSDPEVRSRAGALLARQSAKLYSWRVVLIASGFCEVPPHWWDSATRWRLWWFVKASGVDPCYRAGHPFEYEDFAPWRVSPLYDNTFPSDVRHYEAAMRFVIREIAAGRGVRR